VAISLDPQALERVDRLVRQAVFPSRSRASEAALEEKLDRLERRRLAREAAELDPAFEQALAEERMSEELGSWPEY
jgi:metal-responsive CopG/Arc/MetJ family transcriptional regulator